MIRIHNAEFPIKRWSRQALVQRNITNKPNGLWYDVDGDWKRWCLQTDNLQWICRYNYAIDVSKANILKLSSTKEMLDFTEEYADKAKYMIFVDWARVAKNYEGIEISPFNWDLHLEPKTFWYYGWDCASGCLWNLKNIKLTLINE